MKANRRSSYIPHVHNLAVDLDERFDAAAVADAYRTIETSGCTVEVHRGAPDRVLAWIDDVFGGTWSSEAFAGSNVVVSRNGAPVAFASFDPQGLRFAWLRGAGREDGVGIFGPFGVDPAERGGAIGPATLAIALAELRARAYRTALIAAVGAPGLLSYYARHADARVVETFEPLAFVPRPPRTVILASGNGTNAQAVIDAVRDGLPLDLCAVVSNKPGARVLERARVAKIEAHPLPWIRSERSREAYDGALLDAVAAYRPELVLLLGWMHILDRRFVDAFPEMINVHPAFLPLDAGRDAVGVPDGSEIPAYRGAHAVADAIRDNSRWCGATVHVATLEADRGPVLARKPMRLHDGEDEVQALARLHPIEHQTLDTAIRRWLYER